ncbi:MAG TPA: hypothetical protein VLD65_13085 [Anaerolineales bacterium]|nr:hypothetical protein [Anaerolineales bacterium]
MGFLFKGAGLLGTRAPLVSDISLILIVLTAIMFTIGWRLAVHRRYEAHRWVQTAAVLLNSAVVIIVMVSSYVLFILPGIPAKLGEGSYGITTVHALVGLVSLILGVYVVLVGNSLLPTKLRFTNYKPFMRTAYALYITATLLGVVVYIAVFVFGI